MTRSTQFTITHGPWLAVIDQRGSKLSSLCYQGRELLWNEDVETASPTFQGNQLLPWPNRIRDGRYEFDGETHELAINEEDLHTALHGLAFDKDFTLVAHEESALTLRVEISNEPGWPFSLVCEIRTGLGDDGLVVDVTALNIGSRACPFGYGAHPYFSVPITSTVLEIPFEQELTVDERLLPVELVPVSPEHDFRTPHEIGESTFDTALTGARHSNWQVTLTHERHSVAVWGDATTPWVQVFTHPDFDAIAVEAMTCGPDAFNPGPTRAERIVLEPGHSTSARWGIRLG